MIDTNDPRALVARLHAECPSTMPIADALAQIETRRKELLSPPQTATPEPDFAAASPFPVIDDPQSFATSFWEKREPPPKPKSKPRATSKKRHESPAGAERRNTFRVIPGGKNGDSEA